MFHGMGFWWTALYFALLYAAWAFLLPALHYSIMRIGAKLPQTRFVRFLFTDRVYGELHYTHGRFLITPVGGDRLQPDAPDQRAK